MTIQEALTKAITSLRESDIPSATLDAEVLLSHVLNISKGQLIAWQEKPVTPIQRRKFFRLLQKRLTHWPIAYLTGHKEFYGMDFSITKDVLVPRPETETLIDAVLSSVKRSNKLFIADIGTGSGCIAVTLARYLPASRITAIDISKKALAVAKTNARKYRLLKRIRLVQSSLLGSLKPRLFDILAANLPYLTSGQAHSVSHEPHTALYGGKLGLEIIDDLLHQAPRYLQEQGRMYLEIDPRQTEALRYIVEQAFPQKRLSFHKDLAGRERVAEIS